MIKGEKNMGGEIQSKDKDSIAAKDGDFGVFGVFGQITGISRGVRQNSGCLVNVI